MKLGQRIKQYRCALGYSQEELAELILVSRQSISNWENNKTYPDLDSLCGLSQVFAVSLDTLIKGDIELMKQMIDQREYRTFQKESRIFCGYLIAVLVCPIPLVLLWRVWGFGIFLGLSVRMMVHARRIEQFKKKYDLQTYKEIVTFMAGKQLNEKERIQEKAKYAYQKPLIVASVCLLSLLVSGLMTWLLIG